MVNSKDYNRRSDGKFGSGNDGGPGRPKKQIEQEYLAATSAKVSIEDWEEIVKVAVAHAKAGDHQARKWLSDNLIGLPTQRFDIVDDREHGYLDNLPDEQIDKILADYRIDQLLIEQAKQSKRASEIKD